jgi:uncharacterized protein (DUF2249 family)
LKAAAHGADQKESEMLQHMTHRNVERFAYQAREHGDELWEI